MRKNEHEQITDVLSKLKKTGLHLLFATILSLAACQQEAPIATTVPIPVEPTPTAIPENNSAPENLTFKDHQIPLKDFDGIQHFLFQDQNGHTLVVEKFQNTEDDVTSIIFKLLTRTKVYEPALLTIVILPDETPALASQAHTFEFRDSAEQSSNILTVSFQSYDLKNNTVTIRGTASNPTAQWDFGTMVFVE